MLRLRSDQINEIGLNMEADYIARLMRHIKDKAADLFDSMDDCNLKQRIETAVRSAREFGIKSDEGILKYVSLALFAGNDFVVSKEVEQFLKMPGYSFDYKLDCLMSRVASNLQELDNHQKSAGAING